MDASFARSRRFARPIAWLVWAGCWRRHVGLYFARCSTFCTVFLPAIACLWGAFLVRPAPPAPAPFRTRRSGQATRLTTMPDRSYELGGVRVLQWQQKVQGCSTAVMQRP